MAVKGLMTTPSRLLDMSSRVIDACELMGDDRSGAVTVIEEHRVVGIFTYKDLLHRVLLKGLAPETTLLTTVMTGHVATLTADGSYGEALRVMVENNYTYIPIVDESGRLEGMLSLRALLEHRVDHLADELDSVTQYLSVDGPGGD